MTLLEQLMAFAPQFTDTARINLMLGYAALRINRKRWGSKADFATVLLALHMLTRFDADTGPQVGGVVQGEKVGDLETRYATIDMKGDEELVTTAYGAQFAQMRRALGLTPVLV